MSEHFDLANDLGRLGLQSAAKSENGIYRWHPQTVETASCQVSGINGKRSVSLALLDGGKEVAAGNVTIPLNHDIPFVGAVVEIRYLYAFQESGCLYQPVYLGRRDDIDAAECVTSQLKFKPVPIGTAA